MNSKLTVEVAFDLPGNPPVLQLMLRKSTDTRDQIAQAFKEALGHTSSWCEIIFVQQYREGPDHNHFDRILIRPIKPEELKPMLSVLLNRLAAPASQYPGAPSNRQDLYSAAEWACAAAVAEIESMGADVRLTNAQTKISEAQALVASYLGKK